ncbi:MAG: glycosyltransferase, partial [Bacteroidales bacterium]
VTTRIPYNELVRLYKTAAALIIPLRNKDQDRARFPHKLGEYCASARPIITDRVGEICNYFDETNSYLCQDYDKLEFSKAMINVLEYPEQAGRIGRNGYLTGLKHFNYSSYSKNLASLFS